MRSDLYPFHCTVSLGNKDREIDVHIVQKARRKRTHDYV